MADQGASPVTRRPQNAADSPPRAPLVLIALVLAAAIANLNLAVANVALPTIGAAFDASQTELNLTAVGYSLGLAASVLYLGALGDRYGRKLMLLLGSLASIPFSLLAAFAPTIDVLIVARILGGIAGGMVYPTTLALIAALWGGGKRTRAIALWSAIGAAIASLGPLLSGALLQSFDWGSVFLVTLPLALVAFIMALIFVPAHVNESKGGVDNLGGIISIVMVGALILAINFAVVPDSTTLVIVLCLLTLVGGIAFVLRQRRARNPLYDLRIAARPPFWVAAVAGIIVFGSLMGGMFIGQQFLQNVLGYSTVEAGAAILPAAILMILIAPISARMVGRIGSRMTLLWGYLFVFLGFATMLLLWKEGSAYWQVALGYAFVGAGVGFAQTPAAHSLTGSVPPTRVGMASATADLQRDLGGALMQSIFGALLTAGYAAAFTAAIGASSEAAQVSKSVASQLTKSFDSAEAIAQQYPQYADQITAAAQQSFLAGDQWAYTAGLIAVVIGAALVFFFFPRKDQEEVLVAGYHEQDSSRAGQAAR
jgi:DHA2 family multidrug resistance protein-like MFS transporter